MRSHCLDYCGTLMRMPSIAGWPREGGEGYNRAIVEEMRSYQSMTYRSRFAADSLAGLVWVWVMGVMSAVVAGFVAYSVWRDGFRKEYAALAVFVLVGVPGLLLQFAKLRRAHRRLRRFAAGQCIDCGEPMGESISCAKCGKLNGIEGDEESGPAQSPPVRSPRPRRLRGRKMFIPPFVPGPPPEAIRREYALFEALRFSRTRAALVVALFFTGIPALMAILMYFVDPREFSPFWTTLTITIFTVNLATVIWLERRVKKRVDATIEQRCVHCGYDVSQSELRCPECGRRIP